MYIKRSLLLLLVAVCLVCDWHSKDATVSAKLKFFYGPKYLDHRTFECNEFEKILQDPKYDSSRPTTLYIHGFGESMESDTVHRIVEAYLLRNEHNIIVLDWSVSASKDAIFSYFRTAVPNVTKIGKKMAPVVMSAFKNGLDRETFHVVGHSLGAQLASVMGREIISLSNQSQKLKRITGLDPAYPCFFPAILFDHLSETDASFVDIIHSDSGYYGQPYATGTVDFWPNSGKGLQPGCPYISGTPYNGKDLCSHQVSVTYYAESVASTEDKSFHAIPAESWSHFKSDEIGSTNVVNMGIDCPLTASGDYFLQTNSEAPYSRGTNGIRYSA